VITNPIAVSNAARAGSSHGWGSVLMVAIVPRPGPIAVILRGDPRLPPPDDAQPRDSHYGLAMDTEETPADSPVSVLIADDQALVRAGFRAILESQRDIAVVGEAVDGRDALDLVRRRRPDVVLMDIQMPDIDGLEATRRILAESDGSIAVLMLTTFDFNEYVYGALRAGASGFLLKDVPAEDLIAAVHVVAAGDALIAPAITKRLIEQFVRTAPPSIPPPKISELTPRETEVLTLVARGLSNGEIAADLVLSEATVKTHVKHVLSKLDVRDRVQAVVLAYEAGLVTPGDSSQA
jgi:DNA-binding NarL/FixJ family response regulator